ncbi:AAA family ATPase [Sphingomonas glacialis]|uniref:Rad50/SbcC-type AAA domain-containing protein n=1 Tax=Sphingomonas glacialis TaxID=658225 RepID=A0A502FFP8_9SPHN|nr:AAA family ATPase [Sphingomonas glacialis]TPG48083.1 hypothetical protein EAH76_21975 [Sphingomonas glacialis]
MRVLAIRGRNLASLAGDFAIDFEAAPLADAGIFAITGPTGAGKSTLLDAMCLALYNRVPRLSAAPKRGRVGSETDALSATDPRGLLRQGTTEGFAEIDFVARDKVRYRARWSVSRARTGTLKLVEQTLVSIDTGERIGGTRTDTLTEIALRVGLTAEQFGRAVMLAQGDFEAFIKAEADERAELLEQLTGTEIYSRLGIAAGAKAGALRDEIAVIQQRLDAQGSLSDEARAVAEARLLEVRAAQQAAKGALTALERDRDWYAQLGLLAGRVIEAEAVLATARQAKADAAGRRDALQRRRTAASMIPQWRADAEVRDRDRLLGAELVQLTGLKTQAEDLAGAALERDRSARETAATARGALEAARPTLEAARALDHQIAEADRALTPLRDERDRLWSTAGTAATTHAAAIADHAARLRERAEAAAWLDEATVRGPAAARRQDIVVDLTAFAECEIQRTVIERQQAEAGRVAADAQGASTKADGDLALAVERHAAADAKVTTAQQAAPAEGLLDGLTGRRDALAAVVPCLTAVNAAAAALTRAEEAIARNALETEQIRTAGNLARERANRLAADLPALRERCEAAERAASLSEATADTAAAKLRSALIPGEPCPVCGGTAHAVEALLGLIDDRVAIDTRARDDARRAMSAAERDAAVEAERVVTAAARLEQLAVDAGVAASAATASRRVHADAVVALDAAAAKAGFAVPDAAAARADIEAQLHAIDEERRTLASALAAIETAREDADRTRRLQETAAAEATRSAEASRLAVTTLQGFETRAEALQRELARISTALDQHLAPLFEWRGARDPIARLDELLDEWSSRRLALEEADAALPGLLQQVQAAEIGKVRAADAAEQAKRAADRAEAHHGALVVERAKLLVGEPSDVASARFESAVSTADAVADRVRAEAETAQRALVTVTAQVEACTRQMQASVAAVERQGSALAARLAQLGLDAAEVEAETLAPEGARDAEASALSELDERVTSAVSAVVTRAEDVAAHRAGDAPQTASEELPQALADATSFESAASEVAAEAEAVIRQDDRARAQAATIRRALEDAREAAQIWFRLDDLIGDRDGRKFRRFAQGLTLDRLIFHANARLTELKPRYSLERRQDGEMLIQVVDNDLGGELRGLHNLSGGERFLVSLALALGLSEMSTGQGLSIESLFIDEGFGALDSASLGQAISMLEGLHAGGRRVGVISHIEEVKERIPVKIVVTPVARGRSEVTVESD